MVDKVETCPFCGKEGAFVEQSTFASSYVICNDCGARGPDECQDSDDEDEPGRDAAIVAWNRRSTPTQDTRDRVKVLEEALEPLARIARQEDGFAEQLGTPLRDDSEVLVPLGRWTPPVTLGKSRRARTALGDKETDRG